MEKGQSNSAMPSLKTTFIYVSCFHDFSGEIKYQRIWNPVYFIFKFFFFGIPWICGFLLLYQVFRTEVNWNINTVITTYGKLNVTEILSTTSVWANLKTPRHFVLQIIIFLICLIYRSTNNDATDSVYSGDQYRNCIVSKRVHLFSFGSCSGTPLVHRICSNLCREFELVYRHDPICHLVFQNHTHGIPGIKKL